MSTLFADTAYWIALASPADIFHKQARAIANELGGPVITTEWVLAEFLDGFSSERTRARAANFIRRVQQESNVHVEGAASEYFERGLAFYEDRQDKGWSFTDCTSFLLMKDRSIRLALTSDHHFEQAGFVVLLK